ncbi:MAG: ABC transporter ATP-binding protein [Microthrixaceae bacterium]
MTHAIIAHELTKSFGHGVVVDAVSMTVPQGSVLALLGHNGAGKTTTIRLLNGVLRPDAGHLSVLGLRPYEEGTALRRRTGVATENAGLDDRLTAFENLLTVARLRGIRGGAARRTAEDLLERFGLGPQRDLQCQGFSTGQRRRVALARALMHDPEVLFLDEPTSGLDPAGSRAVMELIGEITRNKGRTVVLCTHFLAEAGETADLMAVLHGGSLVCFGEPRRLAARRWPGIGVRIDLVTPSTNRREAAAIPDMLSALPGVLPVPETGPTSIELSVRDRSVVADVVRLLVDAGLGIGEVTTSTPGLEDVYFAVQRDLGVSDGLSGATGLSSRGAAVDGRSAPREAAAA